MSDVIVSIYHDTRRKKDNHLYPVKLRVYHNYSTRFYLTGIDLSKDDFQYSYQSKKIRQEYKELRAKIIATEARAKGIADELKVFDFDKFEKKLLRQSGSGSDVFHHYEQVIKLLKEQGRVSTASNYYLSAKSFKSFLSTKNKKNTSLPFDAVTPKFLEEYEKWMLLSGKSRTTVGIYSRPLRALFNTAIAEGEIEKDIYPFGKKRYQIPQGRNVKKSLTKEDLKKLHDYPLDKDELMAKARAFFFFSYVTNGMNIKDIAELKYKNINGESLSFVRAKTQHTTKGNQKSIVASLTPFAKQVIKEYGNKKISPETLVFPILKPGLSEEKKHTTIQAFTRFINQHIKRLAVLVGVDPDISTYYARHSFTTISVQNGASLEFIQDSLGHASISTTMNYWAGFSENVKKENANKLMDF